MVRQDARYQNFLIRWLPGFGGNAEVLEPEHFFPESPVLGMPLR
jgi:hypothetical protein